MGVGVVGGWLNLCCGNLVCLELFDTSNQFYFLKRKSYD